ncbi:hypothetical protein VSDG_05897 [Cytospora chrysosperma]|uniref:Ketoreductase (KR) domain-containing protein n=1 Tax=Cytospora chrysosperma TaxID=252740 RepID=A0A423VU35_CYTCH|nr:hypothetical protein VSDG_05897 [Valsa sordida]
MRLTPGATHEALRGWIRGPYGPATPVGPITSSSVNIKLLADLSTIKQTVQRFLALESKLHILFNNAGVLSGAKEMAVTPQGYELHTGVNGLGTFLLSQLLTPILIATAKSEPPSTVRSVWTASSAAEIFTEEKIGVRPETRLETQHLASSPIH